MRSLRFLLLGLALLGAALSNGCCWFFAGGAPTGDDTYSYNCNRLQAIKDVTLPVMHAAMLQGLKDLNIYINNESSDQISGHVDARNTTGQWITINESLLTPRTSTLAIRVGWGWTSTTKSQAEAIYEAVDKRLAAAKRASSGEQTDGQPPIAPPIAPPIDPTR